MRENTSFFKKTYLAAAVFFCCAIPSVQASDIRLSGFVSVGGSIVDNKDGLGGYGEEDLTLNKNLLGLQVSGNVSDKITATAQLIARSGDSYQLNSEWAYLSWQVADNTKVRVGRLRTPFYMFSDSIDIGYSYAWITPPNEVYSIPFNNVDGVDVYNTWTLGSFDTTLQAYFGSFDDELDFSGTLATAKTRNQMGIVGTIGKDWWTLRLAHHKADVTLDLSAAAITGTPLTIGSLATGMGALGTKLLVDEDTATFNEIGLNIDTGKYVAVLERTELEIENSFYPKQVRSLAMVGVKFGDFLVHTTVSEADDEVAHPEAGVANPLYKAVATGLATNQVLKRHTVTLGTRWDVTAGTALKLEFSNVQLAGHDPAKTSDQRSQKVLAVAVQTVF